MVDWSVQWDIRDLLQAADRMALQNYLPEFIAKTVAASILKRSSLCLKIGRSPLPLRDSKSFHLLLSTIGEGNKMIPSTVQYNPWMIHPGLISASRFQEDIIDSILCYYVPIIHDNKAKGVFPGMRPRKTEFEEMLLKSCWHFDCCISQHTRIKMVAIMDTCRVRHVWFNIIYIMRRYKRPGKPFWHRDKSWTHRNPKTRSTCP